jgi:hypothetical protein
VALAQIAKDFGISESCLTNWLKAASNRWVQMLPVAYVSPRKETSRSVGRRRVVAILTWGKVNAVLPSRLDAVRRVILTVSDHA